MDMNIRDVERGDLSAWKKAAIDDCLSLKDWVIGKLRDAVMVTPTFDLRTGVRIPRAETMQGLVSECPEANISYPAISHILLPRTETAIPPYEPPKVAMSLEEQMSLAVQKDIENKQRSAKEKEKSFVPAVGSAESRHAEAFRKKYNREPSPEELESFVKKGW